MARVNVYLPDELAARARAAGVNVSAVTRAALEAELTGSAASDWLVQAARLPALPVEHEQVLEAIGAARDELDGDHGA
jgi:post-segregation antitoxin (ccd killing protein)